MRAIPFSQIPPDHIEVDWSNPITAGLSFLVMFRDGVPIDLVTRVPGIPYSSLGNIPAPKATSYGIGTNIILSEAATWKWPDMYSLRADAGPSTGLWRGIFNTIADYRSCMSKQVGNGALSNDFDVTINAAGDIGMGRANGATFNSYLWSAALSGTGIPHTFSWSFTDNLIETPPVMLLDTTIHTFSAGANTGAVSDGADFLYIGKRTDGVSQMDGVVFMAAIWHRAVSIDDRLALHYAPNQLLKPTYVAVRGFTSGAPPAAGKGSGLLPLMGIGGMVTPAEVLAGAAGAAILRNPRVTRRRILKGGQD